MRWPGAEEELSPEDAAEFRRLCRPGSEEFIVDHPDYYACFTETLFRGRVAAR
jgi:demethylmenaquinone methyltransferase/2-methoxy-6-polyprenyl-1,4-benzoquinol methylase